jgi:RNA polymerase sigma factor (sigma-70 family)
MKKLSAAETRARSTKRRNLPQPPELGPEIRDHLGRCLLAMYEKQASGTRIPERLRSLAERLGRIVQGHHGGPAADFQDGILAVIPKLHAYAITLAGSVDRADDLVQETILRAWEKHALFAAGTNLNAWLYSILRNTYYSEHRRRAREVEDGDGSYSARLASPAEQPGQLDLQDLQSALERIPIEQRELLLLVGAEGLSYEEAAAVCGCAIGTIKSRLNRARHRVAELLGYTTQDLSADAITQSVLSKLKQLGV